mmetsp:Transcript_17469/g.54663  ORF Transcript_17469/g.54663 Transcript_17469/m.54663 type:complete len:276 (+) Transcript_17469:55-882(+)
MAFTAYAALAGQGAEPGLERAHTMELTNAGTGAIGSCRIRANRRSCRALHGRSAARSRGRCQGVPFGSGGGALVALRPPRRRLRRPRPRKPPAQPRAARVRRARRALRRRPRPRQKRTPRRGAHPPAGGHILVGAEGVALNAVGSGDAEPAQVDVGGTTALAAHIRERPLNRRRLRGGLRDGRITGRRLLELTLPRGDKVPRGGTRDAPRECKGPIDADEPPRSGSRNPPEAAGAPRIGSGPVLVDNQLLNQEPQMQGVHIDKKRGRHGGRAGHA